MTEMQEMIVPGLVSAGGEDLRPRQRLRLTYAKGELIKFISHQDEFRLWERSLRRAGLPLLYKNGFNPQPHMHFAAPLGVGFTGAQELLDVVLCPPLPIDEFAARLRSHLTPGVTLLAVEETPLKAESPALTLIGCDYTILLYAAPDELDPANLQALIDEFFATAEIWRERERKGERYSYNLRPLVFELRYEGYDLATEEHRLFLRVQQRPGATGRPDEVVAALGLDDMPRSLRRERFYFSNVPEDAATFARYPVIEQQAISRPLPAPAPVHRPPEAARVAGRTISERAADEFD